MGSGASRRWMTDSHGRLADGVVGTSASPTQLAAGQAVVRQSPASGAPLQTSRASEKDTDDPIPRTDGGGPEQSDGHGGGGRVTYATLADIFGAEGGDAKYIKRHMIGKGAFGEALVVERNANYNPARYPVIEAQFQRNSLAHLTKPRGLYVAKVMDLHNMPARDRHYAQTEIFCLAHTNHFAVIKYYEHYILDSDDETLVIITEYADHGDLSHYLMQTRLLAMRAAEASSNDNNSHNCATNSANVVRGGGGGSGMSGGGGNGSSTSTVGGGGGSETQTSHVASTTNRTLLVEREAGMYFVQLLLALHHIHSRRMIHRDVKSANLFLTSNGVIKLGDFGFSQKYESTVSSESIAGTFLGTPYYLSPEMWQGMRYGKKADIWAAGIVLYEMLMNGRRPFDARTLPELREMVVSSTIVLPDYPPAETNTATSSQHSVGDIAAGAVGSEAPPRPARFSREMRELVQCIFQCDPSRRPSAEELLHMPIMQHYLYVFEKHVQTLIAADDAARAGSVVCDPMALHFTDEEDKSLLLRCLAEAKLTVAREIQKEIHESAFPRYEGVVYKDNRNNVWKERYLILADNVLTISLGKGKEAVDGTERSKKVPLKMVKAVSPCEPEGVLRDSPTTGTCSQGRTDTNSSYSAVNKVGNGDAASAAAPSSFRPPYAFAISMESSNSIVFGVASAEQLDCWLQTLLRALQMN